MSSSCRLSLVAGRGLYPWRFEHPRRLASHLGIVPSERTSNEKRRQGQITKAGSVHARRLLVEAAHHYRHRPAVGAGKLAKSPDVRRRVIGQLFSYAASLWKLAYEDLERVFRACGTSLTQHVADSELNAFRDRVRGSLTSGEFRLIIAVDEISDELARAVTYINALTRPEVDFLALALRDGTVDGERGEVGKDADAIQPLRPRWKRDKFLDALPSDDDRRVADHLLSWAEDRAPQVDSDKAAEGVVATRAGTTLFRIKDHRDVRVSLTAVAADGESTIEEEIRRGLGEVDARFGEDSSRPKAPLEALLAEDKRKHFLDLMQQYLEALTI